MQYCSWKLHFTTLNWSNKIWQNASYAIHETNGKYENLNSIKSQLHYHHATEMSGLPHFAIQVRSWFIKSQPKSKHSPKFFSNVMSKSKWSSNKLKNTAISQQKCRIPFPLTLSKSGPVPKLWRDSRSESNLNVTKFAIVRIQSNPNPVQWSSLPRNISQLQLRS